MKELLIKRNADGQIVQTVRSVQVDERGNWITGIAVFGLLVWGAVELVTALKLLI